ncbi:MAG TPA: C39 family peptidase [Paucimonas sp.]|nr:C39 family peptidase [Paucimonas sp.]
MSETQLTSFTNNLSDPTQSVTFALRKEGDSEPTWYTLPNRYSVTPAPQSGEGSWTVWATVGDGSDTAAPSTPSFTFRSPPLSVIFTDAISVAAPAGNAQSDPNVSPPAAEDGYSILEQSGNWSTLSGDENLGASCQLAFNIEGQKYSQWCWAAVTASVSKFYDAGSTVTQCRLATWKFGSSGDCCSSPLPSGCNKPYTTWKALAHVGNLASHVDEGITFSAVKQEIDSGRPVAMAVKWKKSGSRHAIVITGYDEASGGNTITVQDPGRGGSTSVLKFADFPGNYKGGATWAATFATQP